MWCTLQTMLPNYLLISDICSSIFRILNIRSISLRVILRPVSLLVVFELFYDLFGSLNSEVIAVLFSPE